MTRNEKIKKLGNAIKRLRGLRNPTTGKWVQTPNMAAVDDCVRWLERVRDFTYYSNERIGDQINQDLKTIMGFKTLVEYDDWMKTL